MADSNWLARSKNLSREYMELNRDEFRYPLASDCFVAKSAIEPGKLLCILIESRLASLPSIKSLESG